MTRDIKPTDDIALDWELRELFGMVQDEKLSDEIRTCCGVWVLETIAYYRFYEFEGWDE